MFEYFGDEVTSSVFERDHPYEEYKRWDLETPHEFLICQGRLPDMKHERGAVGHHHHIAFCASGREDIDRFYETVLVPLEEEGLCKVQDPPCDCPEYGEGYYATFFFDPDGLKFEYVINPNYFKKKNEWKERIAEQGASDDADKTRD